jgi:hypothetical protein
MVVSENAHDGMHRFQVRVRGFERRVWIDIDNEEISEFCEELHKIFIVFIFKA